MTRKITIKGVGRVTSKVDYVEISFRLINKSVIYEEAIEKADKSLSFLVDSLCAVGFEKSDIKTTDFDVDTDYKRVEDSNGDYISLFDKYVVDQRIKLSFDLDKDKLAKAIDAISHSLAKPKISINFTIKDKSAVSEELLRSAALDAKRNAKVLCETLGVQLGDLVDINYNWGEIEIYSRTSCDYFLAPSKRPRHEYNTFSNLEAEDIDLKDTATFVWEII